MKNQFITYLLSILLVSCSQKNIHIEPVDKQLNDTLKNGRQYYQISNLKNLSNQDLMNQLESFRKKNISEKKIKKFNSSHLSLHLMFYEKSFFRNYNKYVYKAAYESEFGGIDEFRKNLIVSIIYQEIDTNRTECIQIIYDNDNRENIYAVKLIKKDTISLK